MSETSSTATESDLLEEEWLAAPSSRSRASTLLAGALVVSLAFLGGVLVQKQWGTATTAAALPAGFPGGAVPSGFPEGFGGAAPGAVSGAGSGADSGADSESASDSVSLIGTVVSKKGEVWTVEDLGGTRHTITVSSSTRVVREQHSTTDSVSKGDVVSVTGTNADSDSLAATRVTLR